MSREWGVIELTTINRARGGMQQAREEEEESLSPSTAIRDEELEGREIMAGVSVVSQRGLNWVIELVGSDLILATTYFATRVSSHVLSSALPLVQAVSLAEGKYLNRSP